MSSKKQKTFDDEPTLFDFDSSPGPAEEHSAYEFPVALHPPSPVRDGEDEGGRPPLLPGASDWQEVPAARFLSWTERGQLTYCTARDEDAAEHEESEEWQLFYLERAVAYMRDLQGLTS